MENNFDNTPDNNNQDSGQQHVYTDPNANVNTESTAGTSTDQQAQDQNQNSNPSDQHKYQYTYQQNQFQNQQGQSQNTNYQQYQDQYGNYSYNQNPNQNYNYNYNSYNGANPQSYGPNYTQQPQMDTNPMTMGEWLLTILALFIPCAGLIIYFVWAFGKKGNVNRRNYCRAMLIIYGALIVIYILFFAIFGAMIGTSATYYY